MWGIASDKAQIYSLLKASEQNVVTHQHSRPGHVINILHTEHQKTSSLAKILSAHVPTPCNQAYHRLRGSASPVKVPLHIFGGQEVTAKREKHCLYRHVIKISIRTSWHINVRCQYNLWNLIKMLLWVFVCLCVMWVIPIFACNIIESLSALAEVQENGNENRCSRLRAPSECLSKGRSDDPGW